MQVEAHGAEPSAARTVGEGDGETAALYVWGISPYSYKVRMAAAHAGIPLDARIASFGDCARAEKKTGKRKTPFLVSGDEWVSDSTAICAWIERRSRGRSLFPTGARDRAECELLEDWADEGLSRSVEPWIWMGGGRFEGVHRRVVAEQTDWRTRWMFAVARGYMRRLWTNRIKVYGGLDGTRTLLLSQLDSLERRLDGAPWLFGQTPTVADFAIAGQLANLVRFSCTEDLDERPAVAALVRRAATTLPWWTEEGAR